MGEYVPPSGSWTDRIAWEICKTTAQGWEEFLLGAPRHHLTIQIHCFSRDALVFKFSYSCPELRLCLDCVAPTSRGCAIKALSGHTACQLPLRCSLSKSNSIEFWSRSGITLSCVLIQTTQRLKRQ